MHTIEENYLKNIVPVFMTTHGIKNRMAVPKLSKIVVNCGLGEALSDKKVVEKMSTQMAIITGQKPQVMRARKAISSFKVREGDIVGLRVTLRGTRMFDFMQRFISIALPRVRDFRGIPVRGFDGHGNYTIGIKEQTMFPELEYDQVDKVRGMELSFVTTAKTDDMGRALLTLFGMPFVKE